jgi:hypothetical protein
MAEMVLFHSVLGLRAGVIAAAEVLAASRPGALGAVL